MKGHIMSSYHCGVKNCGNGRCLHELLDERCPMCGKKMVMVTTTGHKFCSNHDIACDYESDCESKGEQPRQQT